MGFRQGWGAGKFISGSGSWLFFQAAPASAPDFFPNRLLVFFQAAPAPRSQKHPGAKNTQLQPAPAPAPDYWLSLPKYSFPHKLVR